MERRKTPRVESGIPVEFDTATERGHLGIGQNVSARGLLLLSRVEHRPGDALTLRFRPGGPEGELRAVPARVVRSEPNDPASLWPRRTALEFDRPVDVRLEALEDGSGGGPGRPPD